MKIHVLIFFLICYQLSTSQNKVLVFHKTNGFRHASISDGIGMIDNLGSTNGLWATDSTDDAEKFTAANLSNYDVVVFCNTSGNNLLNKNQQIAFENFIKAGGGFVGIHAATDTYRDKSWEFYNNLVGAVVQNNPNHTKGNHSNTLDVDTSNSEHPTVSFIDATWDKVEEYYYWKLNGGALFPENKILLTVRETVGSNSEINNYDESRPISWFKEFLGGRSFYTALGHNKGDYRTDDNFIKHIEEGIKWAGKMNENTTLSQSAFNQDVVLEENVFASPNPATGIVTINGLNSKLTYDLHVKVYDLTGKQLISQALSVSINTIDFSELPSGMYFISYSNKAIPPQRIIKN